eukprot:COSAG06_NODE_6460_length_2923_cov_8.881866_1_plen_30_part_10
MCTRLASWLRLMRLSGSLQAVVEKMIAKNE